MKKETTLTTCEPSARMSDAIFLEYYREFVVECSVYESVFVQFVFCEKV